MPAMPERVQTALVLRDSGVALVNRAGTWTSCGPGQRALPIHDTRSILTYLRSRGFSAAGKPTLIPNT
jgi:hypothetical protein